MIRSLVRTSRALTRRRSTLAGDQAGLNSTDIAVRRTKCLHRAFSSKDLPPPPSQEEKGEGGDSQANTRSYIKDNPELEKILRDLYDDQDRDKLMGAMASKFDVYRDDESPVIYDVDEERERRLERELEAEERGYGHHQPANTAVQQMPTKYAKYSLSHGIRGVFDVEDLVDVLRVEKCADIVALSIDPKLGYVDHMVIATCRSKRHLRSSATLVRKLWKLKRQKRQQGDTNLKDPVPPIEGFQNKDSDWLAMDLGNIALHLMEQHSRELYDLETLWSLGPRDESNTETFNVDHSATPSSTNSETDMDRIIRESQELLAGLEPAEDVLEISDQRKT